MSRIRIVVLGLLVLTWGAIGALSLSSASFAAPVSQIVIEGNQRVEDETVLSYLQFTRGGNYTANAGDESVRSLFSTGLFSDVQITQRGNAVIVRVSENPLINVVNFEGNKEIDDETLAKEVEVRERMIFTKARAQSDTRRLLAVYQAKGFYNVRITPKQIRLPENRINLVFEVNEGNETTIQNITFTGNNSFRSYTLHGVIVSREKAWWRFLSRNTNYDAERLEFDKELLRRHYLKNGFADVQIVSADAVQNDAGNFDINFTIDEGPRYQVADVAVNVGDAKLDENGIRRAVKTDVADTYNAERVDKSVENLTLEASEQGFVFAKVEPKVDREPGSNQLRLTYELSEGPRVYIERIDIVGNGRTLDEVIRREIGVFEGDAYNKALIERARRRLIALDFFEKIEFTEREGTAADKMVLVLEVLEKSTGSINFSAGYSSVERVVGGIEVSERNLFGRGQQVRLNTQASFKRQSLDFSFTEPYFMGSPISAGFDLFGNRNDQKKTSSFTSETIGGALRTGFRLDENSRVDFKYYLARRKVKDISVVSAAPAVIEQEGVNWKSSIGGTYTYDDLDNPIRPTSGLRAELKGEIAGLGGTDRFASLEASAWYFIPAFDETVTFKIEGNAGHVRPLGGGKVPFQDRFFHGADTFRGFASSGIGTKQIGNDGAFDSIGSNTYAIGTLEAIFPLGLPEALGVEGVAFTDFGTVFGSENNSVANGGANCPGNGSYAGPCSVLDSKKLRASIGAGIIWQSPFGPLRLEAAYPIMSQKFDEKEWFSFSIGTRF